MDLNARSVVGKGKNSFSRAKDAYPPNARVKERIILRDNMDRLAG
jgi:hypothetical protein